MPGRVLSVKLEPAAAAATLREVLAAQGWREAGADGTDLLFQRGSRGLSVVLGAFAGPALYQSARVAVHERPHGADVDYRWGGADGLVLGGLLGRRRAQGMQGRTLDALEERLGRDGVLHAVRQNP